MLPYQNLVQHLSDLYVDGTFDEDEKTMDRWVDEDGIDPYEGINVCENMTSFQESPRPLSLTAKPYKPPVRLEASDFIFPVQDDKTEENQMPYSAKMSEYRDKVPTCIAWALQHTKEIASRHNGYNTRLERVGEFVTSLRREIARRFIGNAGGKELVSAICQTELWRDAGVLERDFNLIGTTHGNITKDDVIRWEQAASKAKIPWHLLIQGELEDMKRDVAVIESDIERLDRLTEEADEVMEKLTQVLEPLTAKE